MTASSLYLSCLTGERDTPLTLAEKNQLAEEMGLDIRFEEITDSDIDAYLNSFKS